MTAYYWVPSGGSSNGNWNSTNTANWSLTSGGAGGAGPPVAGDDAIFDANSDNGTSFTVTVVATGPTFRNLTVSGLDQAMVLTGTTGLIIQGDISLPASGFTWSNSGTLTISGSASRTLTTNGVSIASSTNITAAGATITLGSALTIASNKTLACTAATLLDFAGFNVTAGGFTSTGATARSWTLGTGTITVTGSGSTAWGMSGGTNLTLTTTGSTILLSSASAKTFAGNGYTYGEVVQGGAGALTISGANTIARLSNTAIGSILFTAGVTQTINDWAVNGTAGNLVTVNSTAAGSAATVSKASGIVSADYLSLKDITATGGATWYAGANSTNTSGNTGWNFTAPPAGSMGNFFLLF